MKNLLDKTHKTFNLDGIWLDVLGNATTTGFWIIYGSEKNGKSTFALMLADYLRALAKVLYISAEEGTDKEFVDAVVRAGLVYNSNNILFIDYESLEDLTLRLGKPKAPKVVFLDNATIYQDELGYGGLLKLRKDNPGVLFILIAHEERGKPYTAPAALCRKLAKIIFHVKGSAVTVSGRCPGGILIIDEKRAALYHGQAILENA